MVKGFLSAPVVLGVMKAIRRSRLDDLHSVDLLY